MSKQKNPTDKIYNIIHTINGILFTDLKPSLDNSIFNRMQLTIVRNSITVKIKDILNKLKA